MSLAEALISIPQSERGGEIAQRGFDYQTCWALSQMLEYELDGRDYVFIFEYHDDVLIIDSEDHPQDLIFAQVKTRESNWTVTRLQNTTDKKPISIIGKLFLHQKNFLSYTPKLLFVTNASFSFHPKAGGKTCFDAISIESKHQDTFKQAIKDQIELAEEYIDLSALKFIQSSLSLDDHMTHLKGKLCDFLSKKYGENTTLSANALATLLESECRQKSKFKSADITSFMDLVSRKGFSSKAFNSVIDSLNISNSLMPDWKMAESIFKNLSKSALQLIQLKAAFLQVCIDLNKNTKNPASVYLEYAINFYDQDKIDTDLKQYLDITMINIDVLCSDYTMALTPGKKECIVVYSIIQKLLEEGEK
ncbi:MULTISPECIES: DUF4297 domain-containing protein [Xenorhabdus]|uniref:DUF4297 domain-containing protein n=1 Tax=Xenorhabdus TaxID=626 RepID=UPI000646EC8A|nr:MULTISPECIES: DUF4297 domain-containing protein [Xenorhabdus]